MDRATEHGRGTRLLHFSNYGVTIVALDLAASGVNQKQALELKSISAYFEPLTKFMASSEGEKFKEWFLLVIALVA
ncbi:hypothetical protein AHAS_Ahas20G0153300 [Arachis hypogaea]